MGRVLLAHDPLLDRAVALKHLRDDLRIPREVREGLIVRMRHEARAAARVTHPNLVTLHDVGEDPDFGLYLVFEYVEGPTLKERLLDQPLSAAQAARLARELGEALTIAHRAGVVHRDVKPENIILSSKGGKIADFGIARIPDSTLTHQGGLMGTPAYSAPETFRAGKFSPESDQFSLAAVMYEAISGQRAFPGDDAVSVAARITQDEPPPIARALGVSPSLDEVLARGLSKRPEHRYPSCEAFGAAFAQSLAPVGVSPIPRYAPEAPISVLPPQPAPIAQSTVLIESDFPPRERKTGQILLGAAVVLATAVLLVRTALRSTDVPGGEPVAAASLALPQASAPQRQPHPDPPTRPARPKPEPAGVTPAAPVATAAPSASAKVDVDVAADAGATPESERADAGVRPLDESDDVDAGVQPHARDAGDPASLAAPEGETTADDGAIDPADLGAGSAADAGNADAAAR